MGDEDDRLFSRRNGVAILALIDGILKGTLITLIRQKLQDAQESSKHCDGEKACYGNLIGMFAILIVDYVAQIILAIILAIGAEKKSSSVCSFWRGATAILVLLTVVIIELEHNSSANLSGLIVLGIFDVLFKLIQISVVSCYKHDLKMQYGPIRNNDASLRSCWCRR